MSKSSGIILDCRNLGDLYDDSRNHHTITNHNAIPVRGIHGRGMYFNGTTAYLDCGNPSALNITDAITIEAWMKGGAFAGSSRTIAGKSFTEYYLCVLANDVPAFYTGYSDDENSARYPAISAGQWYYIVGVHDGIDTIIYVNGNKGANALTPLDIGSSAVTKVYMGSYEGITRYFNGTIDNVTIYNYALSADEIKLHYRQQSPYYQEEAPTICL